MASRASKRSTGKSYDSPSKVGTRNAPRGFRAGGLSVKLSAAEVEVVVVEGDGLRTREMCLPIVLMALERNLLRVASDEVEAGAGAGSTKKLSWCDDTGWNINVAASKLCCVNWITWC